VDVEGGRRFWAESERTGGRGERGVIHRLPTGYPQTPDLSTGYPQARAKVIHRLSTGQNRCVKATQKKVLVDNRVNSSDFTVEQSSCESYTVVESHSVITLEQSPLLAVEQSLFTVEKSDTTI
jgi:type II secretory pathway component PulJ